MPISRRLLLASLAASPAIPHALGDEAIPQTVEGAGPAPDLSAATPVVPKLAPTIPAQASSGAPAWRRHAIRPPAIDGKPAITIVIDDMGWTHPQTSEVIALPGPLTLSWFPFAPRLGEQVEAGMARGHETMLHMPMQAHSSSTAQTGPDPLRVDLPNDVNLARLRAAMDAVPRTVGLNNHMGSVATLDPGLMDIVALETKARGLLFLDSITIPHSVALSRAEAAGVPAAGRDIFIDWKMHADIIATQLALVEATARHRGHVIAIGHPRKLTIEALTAWLPTLPGKGFSLWPMSATVAWRNKLNFPIV